MPARERPARLDPDQEQTIRAAHRSCPPTRCRTRGLLDELDALRAENHDLHETLSIHQTTSDYDAGVHFASLAAAQRYGPLLAGLTRERDAERASSTALRDVLAEMLEVGIDEPLMVDPATQKTTFWFCGGTTRRGHELDCRWAALLALAAAEPQPPAPAGHLFVPLSGSQDAGGIYRQCSVHGCDLSPEQHQPVTLTNLARGTLIAGSERPSEPPARAETGGEPSNAS